MGRWHSIANKKAAGDAQKSKTYAKIGKLIEMAVRSGGPDSTMNPNLDLVLQKARYYSLPREVIDKAIKKGSGQSDGQTLSEVMYEGYGPAGSALYIRCIASNTNRTAATVRSLLAKMGGVLAEPGAVSWQFSQKGVIIIDGVTHTTIVKGNEVTTVEPYTIDELEQDILSCDIEDYQEDGGVCRIITSREAFVGAKKEIEKKYHIVTADIQYLPQNEVVLSPEDMQTFTGIVDALEEDDDVDTVYSNVS